MAKWTTQTRRTKDSSEEVNEVKLSSLKNVLDEERLTDKNSKAIAKKSDIKTARKIKSTNNKKTVSNKEVGKDSKKRESKPLQKKKKKGKEIYFSKVSPLDIAMYIRHLALMLKAGMPLSDALHVLEGQSSDKRLQNAFADLSVQVQKGTALAEAMKSHPKIFSFIVRSIIDVGEQGATLEGNLVYLADFLKQSYELERKVKGAMTYPMIVFGLTVTEMLGVIFYILPKLDDLFSSFDNIPAFTEFMLNLSKYITNNIYFIIGGSVIFVTVYKIFMKTKAGKKLKEYMAINFPIIKDLNRKHILTNFSRTLGILLESGLPIVTAIDISANTVGNSFYTKMLKDVHDNVKDGNTLSSSLEKYKKFFPGTFTKMIAIGEETGTLEENLLYLHDFYMEEVSDMSDNLTTLLEPILLVFIGAMVGLLALSVISPMYQLTGSINSQ